MRTSRSILQSTLRSRKKELAHLPTHVPQFALQFCHIRSLSWQPADSGVRRK
jgi:hypothetical protein